MRRNATPSSKGSGAGRGSRLRLTVLLATVAAFLLIPAAQAAAEGTLKVNIASTGTGSGEVISGGPFEGTPQIDCFHVSPGPTSGVCENTMQAEPEFGFTGIVTLTAAPGPGSEFVGWTIEEGEQALGCGEETQCYVGEIEGGNAKVTATFASTEPAPVRLTVAKEGTGNGTVVSSSGGIECGFKCAALYEKEQSVVLTASPAVGSTFSSWKNCTTVNGRQCTVTMSASKKVSAKFTTTYNLTVSKVTGSTGLGKVQSSPGGIICDASCSANTAAFKEGTTVKLTPTASKGSTFTEWAGACTGSTVPCEVTSVSEAQTVEAKFTEIAKSSLTIAKLGGGQGVVKSKPASINCGLTCSKAASSFYVGTEVEISVTLGKGTTSLEWGFGGAGTCTGSTNPCKVTLGINDIDLFPTFE